MTKHLATGLFLSLLGTAFAVLPVVVRQDTRHYWAERIISLRLQSGTEVKIRGSTNIYLTPVDSKNTYSVTLRNTSIPVQTNEGKLIDLVQCECQKPLGDYLSRPFLAVFDDKGVLKNIEIDCDENDLSANVKMLATSHFQLDIPQLKGTDPPVAIRDQITAAGLCPIKSEILKQKDGQYQIKDSVDLVNCKGVRKDDRSDKLTCLGQTCRSTKEKNLKWTSTIDAWVKNVNGAFVLDKSDINQCGSYNPHEESDEEISWNLNINTRLVSIKKTNIPLFRGGKTVTVNGPRFPKIDEGVCESETWNGLTDMYGAVVCEQPFSFMYEDIIAKAIECY